MTSPESSDVAAQLDQHHLPETNGRIAVCRRCGARTDSPAGCTTCCRKVKQADRPSGSPRSHA